MHGLSQAAERQPAFSPVAATRARGVLASLILAVAWLVGGELRAQSEEDALPLEPASLPDILSDGTLQPKAQLWLSTKDGSRVFVPDESYHDYLLSGGSAAAGQAQLPVVSLQKIDIEVDCSSDSPAAETGATDIARIEAQFTVSTTQSFATSLELQLASVQLTDWEFSSSAKRNLILPTANAAGWRWILEGEPDKQHSATLSGVSRVLREADRRSLRLDLPTAPATLRIKLPLGASEIRVRNEDVELRNETEDGIELVVQSRGGEFSLTWRDHESAVEAAAIKATSSTEFVITEPTQPWSATTTLQLRCYGQDASREIRLQLPPGGQWRSLPSSNFERYEVYAIEPDEENEAATEGTKSDDPRQTQGDSPGSALQLGIVISDLDRNEPIEVPLQWEWVPPTQGTDPLSTEVSIAAPWVHGADEHQGEIDCILPSAYVVVFRQGAGASLIHQGPLMDVFGRQQLQFDFDRQPFDLSVVFRREQSLPTVRPTYLVNVDANKLVLTMWFDCSFDTNQPQMEIGLILDEWLIQENTARVVNDPSQPFSSEGDILRVQQQVDRNYVVRSTVGDASNFGGSRHIDQIWRVVAERSWTAEDRELYLQVPQIIRGRVNGNPETDHGSGALLVSSDSNVLLSWQEAASTGLQRDSFSTEYQRFVRDSSIRKPLVYRFQSSETPPVWAGKAELLPRQVSVEQHATVEVIASQVDIRQNFQLQVANQPLSELRFALRQDAGDLQPPQVFVNGNLVSVVSESIVDERQLDELLRGTDVQAIVSQPETSDQEELSAAAVENALPWRTYRLLGNPDILGSTALEIRSGIPWGSAAAGGAKVAAGPVLPTAIPGGQSQPPGEESEEESDVTAISVPLAQLLLPSETRRARQEWTLETDLRVEVINGADESSVQDTLVGGQRVRALGESQKALPLSLRPRRLISLAPVKIHKSWLQSFVSGRQRRERFAMRVESATGELRVKLPKEANIQVKVSVDGYTPLYDIDQRADLITIRLDGDPTQSHVVEVSYLLADTLSWASQLNLLPPQILGAKQSGPFYWQLITPSVQHLAWSPAGLTAEWTWDWSGLWWERKSRLDQIDLEEWLDTAYQDPPPASANNYVMSGQVPDVGLRVWVLSRFALWFPVGLIAIAIAFTVLNFPVVRRPAYVLILATALTALAMIWPDMAVLVGQTAVFALGLVVLMWVVQTAVDARVRRRSVFSSRPSTYVDRSDHFSVARGPRTATPAVTHAPTGSSVGVGGGS